MKTGSFYIDFQIAQGEEFKRFGPFNTFTEADIAIRAEYGVLGIQSGYCFFIHRFGEENRTS